MRSIVSFRKKIGVGVPYKAENCHDSSHKQYFLEHRL